MTLEKTRSAVNCKPIPVPSLHSIFKSIGIGKLVGFDKKLSKSLDHGFEFDSSPTELCGSPLGPLAESSCRKTLIYLILTLNHVYPDHDFSVLRAHHFRKENNPEVFEQTVQHHLQEVAKVDISKTRRLDGFYSIGTVRKTNRTNRLWKPSFHRSTK